MLETTQNSSEVQQSRAGSEASEKLHGSGLGSLLLSPLTQWGFSGQWAVMQAAGHRSATRN